MEVLDAKKPAQGGLEGIKNPPGGGLSKSTVTGSKSDEIELLPSSGHRFTGSATHENVQSPFFTVTLLPTISRSPISGMSGTLYSAEITL